MADSHLSKYMKILRKKYGYTQDELAEKLGLTRSNYSHYETGFSQTPIDILDKLSQIYNVPLMNFIKLYALSGKQTGEEIDLITGSAGIQGLFLDNPDSPSEDPFYLDFISNFPDMTDKELRKWMTPEDCELVYNYHKLSSRYKKIAMTMMKILIFHDVK